MISGPLFMTILLFFRGYARGQCHPCDGMATIDR